MIVDTFFPCFVTGTFELLEDSGDAGGCADDADAIRGAIAERPGATTRAICDASRARGVSRSRTLAVLERETGTLWRWEPGTNRSHHYYLLGGVPGAPPNKAAEHRNTLHSQCSATVPGTPEHIHNKEEDELNSAVHPVFQETPCALRTWSNQASELKQNR
jgi:hypothetical protein